MSAGRKADLNSSQREDHSTSKRGGSRPLGGDFGYGGNISHSWNQIFGLCFWGIATSVPEGGSYFRLTSVFLASLFSSALLCGTGAEFFGGFRVEEPPDGTPPPPSVYCNH